MTVEDRQELLEAAVSTDPDVVRRRIEARRVIAEAQAKLIDLQHVLAELDELLDDLVTHQETT